MRPDPPPKTCHTSAMTTTNTIKPTMIGTIDKARFRSRILRSQARCDRCAAASAGRLWARRCAAVRRGSGGGGVVRRGGAAADGGGRGGAVGTGSAAGVAQLKSGPAGLPSPWCRGRRRNQRRLGLLGRGPVPAGGTLGCAGASNDFQAAGRVKPDGSLIVLPRLAHSVTLPPRWFAHGDR
ncbi:hypothetical protein GCM10009529_32970 [Micropruina glycogenica]